jgi:hypothetical protein
VSVPNLTRRLRTLLNDDDDDGDPLTQLRIALATDAAAAK